ncbi:MAG: hypothetical protein JXQ75_03975 [Phycisphaerae bacterium]|nr:hypothetical protein [Phycisphaerae bacterium]
MPPVKLAFVGSARDASPWLLSSLARVGTFEAICDEDADGGAARHHARWAFSDLATMLREAEPDGVVLHKPLGDRPRLIKQCLAAGAGVLVAGPPGGAAACKRLASFSKLSGQIILAAPAVRYSPAMLLARRLVESGKLGAPVSMTLQSTRRGSPRVDSEDRGAVPNDQVFEAVYVVHHLIGPIERAFAMEHEDGALVASAMTVPGVLVSMVFHASGPSEAVGIEVEIHAADGTRLQIDRGLQLLCGNGSRVDAAHRVALGTVEPAIELGYEGLAAEFRRHLEAGRSGSGLLGPVGAATAATEAVLGSAARGRPVAVKQAKPGSGRTAVGLAAGRGAGGSVTV